MNRKQRLWSSLILLLACPFISTAQDCDNDTTVPAVNCLNGLSYNLAPNAMLVLQARDLDAGTTDNCSTSEQLLFSFSSDSNDSTRTLVCDDLGTIDLELWVTDQAGNQDFCTLFMSIEDVFNACSGGGGAAMIAGCVTTEDGIPMENVGICFYVDPLTSPFLDTEVEGCYSLQIPDSDSFSGRLMPKKDGDDTNGVTTFDMVLIRKHVLNIDPLDSPYKLIAADANGSGSVSTFDIVLIRKIILGISSEFAAANSWRFVPRDYEFPQADNPFSEPFPEDIDLVGGHATPVDFIAIKMGDVNNSASTE